MSLPAGPHYLWLQRLPPEFQDAVGSARSTVGPVLVRNLLPHFTDHSVNHSDRIIGILEQVLEENLSLGGESSLSDDEILILVLAALFHDIGMQVPKAHGIEAPVNELTSAQIERMRSEHGAASARMLRSAIDGDDAFGIGSVSPPLK